jgi:hypothetical protein
MSIIRAQGLFSALHYRYDLCAVSQFAKVSQLRSSLSCNVTQSKALCNHLLIYQRSPKLKVLLKPYGEPHQCWLSVEILAGLRMDLEPKLTAVLMV